MGSTAPESYNTQLHDPEDPSFPSLLASVTPRGKSLDWESERLASVLDRPACCVTLDTSLTSLGWSFIKTRSQTILGLAFFFLNKDSVGLGFRDSSFLLSVEKRKPSLLPPSLPFLPLTPTFHHPDLSPSHRRTFVFAA